MHTSACCQAVKGVLCGAGDRALPLPGRDDSAHKATGPKLKDEEAGFVPGKHECLHVPLFIGISKLCGA